jgi:hypothetical protein
VHPTARRTTARKFAPECGRRHHAHRWKGLPPVQGSGRKEESARAHLRLGVELDRSRDKDPQGPSTADRWRRRLAQKYGCDLRLYWTMGSYRVFTMSSPSSKPPTTKALASSWRSARWATSEPPLFALTTAKRCRKSFEDSARVTSTRPFIEPSKDAGSEAGGLTSFALLSTEARGGRILGSSSVSGRGVTAPASSCV